MKLRHILLESVEIVQNGEKQELFDPYDTSHTAQVNDWITVDLNDFNTFKQDKNLIFFNQQDVPDDNRGAYKLSINAIPLNQRTDNDLYAHILKVKITGSGKKKSDPREFVYYIMYSENDFNDSFMGNRRYPVERVDQLPIYATDTGIGTNRNNVQYARNYWSYLSPSATSAKGQDKLNPRDFPQLKKYSFIDNHGTTGIYGNIGRGFKQAKRRAELDIPDDNVDDNQRELFRQTNATEIANQNNIIIQAITKKKITAEKMVGIIRRMRGADGSYRSQRSMNYLADLTEKFTESRNNPSSIYPLQLVKSNNDRQLIKDIGIQGVNTIAVDFMEVLHPVILLYGNCNGNARNMASRFFGVSQEELIKNAVISYTKTHQFPLIDSAIFYKSDNGRGFKRLGVSTKQTGRGEGAGGSKFPSLQVAWREVQAIANDRWNNEIVPLLNRNPRFKLAWEVIRYKMADENFSQDMINNLRTSFNISDQEPLKVFLKVAESPEFKQLVIWIFNHSATIQIDTRADYGNEERPAVITNIVATWPTQLASSVTVSETGDSIKLLVNDVEHDFTPELTDRADVEYDQVGDAENRYRPSDYADKRGIVNVNRLSRYGGGTTSVNYGRAVRRIVNPITFTTQPLSTIQNRSPADGAVRYTIIRLARMVNNFKYLPYNVLLEWTQTNTIRRTNESRIRYRQPVVKRTSDWSAGEIAAKGMNESYKTKLEEHGVILSYENINKFPISTNTEIISAFEGNIVFINNRGKLGYNPLFISVLQAFVSDMSGDIGLGNAVKEFVNLGQTNNRLLMALEKESLSLIDGKEIDINTKNFLDDWYNTLSQNTQRAIVSPEEQRIQRILAIAKAAGKAKDEKKARDDIRDVINEPDLTDNDIADLLGESSSILRGILTTKLV